MSNKWFYDLANQINEWIDKVNEDLGDDIYYTEWDTINGSVTIRDLRNISVVYVWVLDPLWGARLWKDSFRKRFDRIIDLLKAKYREIERRNNMDKEKDLFVNKLTYDPLGARLAMIDYNKTVTTDELRLNWSKLEELCYIRVRPEWKKWMDKIDRVIFNDPATIILWRSGERTVVKCGPNEDFDKEKGLAMALCKYVLGNTGNFNEFFKSFMKEE